MFRTAHCGGSATGHRQSAYCSCNAQPQPAAVDGCRSSLPAQPHGRICLHARAQHIQRLHAEGRLVRVEPTQQQRGTSTTSVHPDTSLVCHLDACTDYSTRGSTRECRRDCRWLLSGLLLLLLLFLLRPWHGVSCHCCCLQRSNNKPMDAAGAAEAAVLRCNGVDPSLAAAVTVSTSAGKHAHVGIQLSMSLEQEMSAAAACRSAFARLLPRMFDLVPDATPTSPRPPVVFCTG